MLLKEIADALLRNGKAPEGQAQEEGTEQELQPEVDVLIQDRKKGCGWVWFEDQRLEDHKDICAFWSVLKEFDSWKSNSSFWIRQEH